MSVPGGGRLGRYEIRRELGRGTMGVVYEAEDPLLGRTIALKTIQVDLPPDSPARAAFEARFFAEARAAARLSHPGIVVVHDVGRDPETGSLYIALEFLRGRTLASLLGQLDWREALRLLAGVAEALHHAHENGVIHRDVKPENVMILESGEPKVMDFGIAKLESVHLTGTNEMFGTPRFMSPEQAVGLPMDRRSDVFALGAMGYALLTGRHAFDGATIPLVLLQVCREDPPPPSSLVPALPPTIDAFLARALAKAPSERYPTARELAVDALDIVADRTPRYLEGRTTPTGGAPTGSTLAGLVALHAERKETEAGGTAPAGGPPMGSTLAGLVALHAQRQEAEEGDSPLAALVSSPDPSPTRSLSAGSADAAPSPGAASAAGGNAPRRRRGGIALLAGAVLLAFAAALLLGRGARPEAHPSPGGSRPIAAAGSTAPDDAPSTAPASSPSEAGGESPAPIDLAGSAELAISFEHSVEECQLRVFVDDTLLLERALRGREVKRLGVLKSHTGRLLEVFPVAPGLHEIRIEAAWGDTVKIKTLTGTFVAGSRRRVEASLVGFRKSLSADWQ